MKRVSILKVEGATYVRFHCPGCDTVHSCKGWVWNGSEELPTLNPSVLNEYNGSDAGGEGPPARCHSFVRDGRIEFLTDSTHTLAGSTADLPEWPVGRWGP